MKKFSKKKELWLKAVRKLLQIVNEALIKTICYIKSQTIYIKIVNPILNLIKDMINNSLIVEVELTRS